MKSKIMSFSEFERVYEANEYILEDEVAPPKDDPKTSVVSSDGSIEENPEAILDLLKDLGTGEGEEKTGEGEEKTKKDAPNESLAEQSTLAPVNTLKASRMGEKSDRVKDIQKLLGLNPSGNFDQETKNSVSQFQTEQKKKNPKIIVDGIVGNQTYGLLLKVKKGITDQSEISSMLAKFQSSGKTVVSVTKAGTNLALDPKLYEIFEKIEIITNNGTTYVVATPRPDAAAIIERLKKSGKIGSGFAWLLAVPLAVGKALVYTALGVVVITIEVAKAMVNAAISAGAYIGRQVMAVASNIAIGLGQISKWVQAKGAEAWSKIKQDVASSLALWKGFNEKAKAALKASAQAALAWAAAVGASLSKDAQALRAYTLKIVAEIGTDLKQSWAAAKTLGELVKTGLSKVKEGVQAFTAKLQTEYDEAVARTKAIGSAVVIGFKKGGEKVVNVIKSGISAAGDALISAGSWLKNLVESLEVNNGELVLEWLEY